MIGVTSTLRGEGRSTVAAALAASHVASGSKTLLVDADMKNPAIAAAVSSSSKHVLQSLLVEAGSLKIFTSHGDDAGLHILPMGIASRDYTGEDWLASAHVSDLLSIVKQHYDVVVFDFGFLRSRLLFMKGIRVGI